MPAIQYSGEDHGDMLQGEQCNRVFIPTGLQVSGKRLEQRGFIGHLHAPVNHMGYSPKIFGPIVIIQLN